MSPVPAALRRKYFMRSRDKESKQVRVVPELRSTIEFKQMYYFALPLAMQDRTRSASS